MRRPALFIVSLLLIEFLDEFIYGVRESALPLIRTELDLSYEQVGLLLSLPNFLANFIEIGFGVLADTGKRRALVLGGGIVFVVSLLLTAISPGFGVLMLAFTLFSPASGAFVGISQAALVDTDPARREQNMARWTLAGSLGVVAGPLALSAALSVGQGWRALYGAMAVMGFVLLAIAWRYSFKPPVSDGDEDDEAPLGIVESFRKAAGALKRREVMRWLALLQFSDLALDVLHGYLALYFADVVGVDPVQAGLAVAVWTGVGLLGDVLLLPLLERVRGLVYLRFSALVQLGLYPAFLLVPGVVPKLLILALMGFFNSGWYSILQAQLYASLPGQSGAALALSNVAGIPGSLIPLAVGLVAGAFGLQAAMWLLLLGPLALLVGIPRKR